MNAGRLALAEFLRTRRTFARTPGDTKSLAFLIASRDYEKVRAALTDHLWAECEPVESARHLAVIGADSAARVTRQGGRHADRRRSTDRGRLVDDRADRRRVGL